MITLAAASTLRALAGTATAVTLTVFGDELTTGDAFKKLYQGQMPTSTTTVYTVPGSTTALIKTIMMVNTTASPVSTALYVDGTAAANIIASFTIPANGEAVWAGDGWKVLDATGALLTTTGGGGGGGSSFGIVTGNTGTATADAATDSIAITGTGVISTAAGDGPETLVISSAALTGDVTTSGAAATIANDAVTNAKAADMAQATIKGRAAGAGTGDPTDLTEAQVIAVLSSAFPQGVGAWSTYTPTWTQSATVTKTVNTARYMQFGKTVFLQVRMTATGAGTAANAVVVGLPVTAAASTTGAPVGSFVFLDSGFANYVGTTQILATTTVAFYPGVDSGTGGQGALGTSNFTAAVASGDVISFEAVYEAA